MMPVREEAHQVPRGSESHSWIEVCLASIRQNIRVVKGLVGEGCWLWAVVKADAYGHGAVPVAKAAVTAGADGLAVACLQEAAELRRAGLQVPILHLHPGNEQAANRIVRLGLTQTVCTEPTIRALSRASQHLGRPARVHLKVDTGMGRLGIRPDEAARFARLIEDSPGIRLEGVFSHLATAEAADDSYARLQFGRYEAALHELREAGISPGMRHLCNSAATLRFHEMRLDAVRVGLLTYGILPQASGLPPLDLQQALTWKTRIAFAHRLPAGHLVSYGCTYRALGPRLVAALPVGYADGYPRHASNRGRVLLRGHSCPIVGMVCMDYTMIDATAAGSAEIGDEVVLLGRQGVARITPSQLADWAETVVHEVTTGIGRRVAHTYAGSDD